MSEIERSARYISGDCAICHGSARLIDGRWCESCGKSGTVHMVATDHPALGAVGALRELRDLLTEAVRQDYGTPGWRARAIKAGCLLDTPGGR